jgi:peptide/nickel transport system substrate-binding protein
VLAVPHSLSTKVDSATGVIGVGGLNEIEDMVSAGLAHLDQSINLQPQLAEAVPTVENGLWQLKPDGGMETRWIIRTGAQWHDGVPITADDFLFTARVAQDRELAAFSHIAFSSVESVEAPDSHTIVVKWNKPFIAADAMFTRAQALPLPKHLLEDSFNADKANFLQIPYWTTQFIGSGPYKAKTWDPGAGVSLEANPQYVLGRPRIDALDVRFMADSNTMVANVLAGAVQVTLGRGLSLEQAIEVRDQWASGRMDVVLDGWIMLYPQFIDPQPALLADARFRRALLQSIDRPEMANGLQAGMTSVADSFMSPGDPGYQEVQSQIVRYQYDPRGAAQTFESFRYTRGPDGTYRDAGNEPFAIEVRQSGIELSRQTMFAVAGYWQRLGIAVDAVAVPPQRAQDRAYMATFPAFVTFNQPTGIDGLRRTHSANTSLPENGFRTTGNWSRYNNPEYDALIDQLFNTIPWPNRTQVLGQIVHQVTDQLTMMGLFYNTIPTLVDNRLLNVYGKNSGWNADQWELKERE